MYTRVTGEPQTVSDNFSVLNPNTHYTLHIDNHGVSSAVISVNGTQIFGPSDFDPHVAALDRAVTLTSKNKVTVELRGKPEASLAITVIGVDNDPPSILELVTPPPNGFGWNNTNVGVSFICSDATSGIAVCPAPLVLNKEGLNQVAAGIAVDLASNSTTSSIQVSIDLTPPTISALASPAPNAAGWNNSAITVNFSCSDALSGVALCPAPVTVSLEGANQQVSGTAVDKAGNSSSTSIQLNIDQTPPVIGISAPANGTTVTTAGLQITGTVSDNLSGVASVSCNSSAAVIVSQSFQCNVTLVPGQNAVQVQAMDIAGNAASTQIAVIFNATPPPPPKSILITPSMVNMLIGDTRSLKLIGDIGQAVTGATWSISDPTVAKISSADPPQLTALGQGTTTLTATFNGLTAAMTINVLPGAALPAGTALWSFDPLPGNTMTQLVPGNPVNPGEPDIFAVEAPNTLRAFTKDGLQLWAVPVGASTGSAATVALPLAIQQQNIVTPQSQSAISPFGPAQTLASIPTAAQDVLRKHGAFDSLDLMLRQQRLIEQQRGRASPRNATGTSASVAALSPVLMPSNAAASDLTTLLIKAVPDNSGGVISLVEIFTGCCSLTQASFIKIDAATQQQVWRHDFSSSIDENFAIGDDNTVYSSQVIFSGTPSIFFGRPSTSLIFALDGATGQQKFSLPLPPGHFKFTDTEGIGSNPTVITLADLDVAAQPGPLSILPDGSINAVVATNHLEEDFQRLFSGGGSETAVSDHKTLQLLTIEPDGSFATRPLQAFDFSQTGCQGFCNDPGAGYIPNEVIPDGQGGLLATWSGNDTQLGITNSSAAVVRHLDNAGGILDYAVPFASQSWFRIGGNNPQSLVLGDDTIAFGTDGQAIIAFDVNTGAQQWSFVPDNFQGTALLGATEQGEAAAIQLGDFGGEFDATPNALLAIDAGGTVSAIPFAANSTGVFDANTLLAVTATNGVRLVGSVAISLSNNWFRDGRLIPNRLAPTPKITTISPSRGLIGSTLNVQIQGVQLSKIVSVDAGPGITATINPKNRSNSRLTITLSMDATTVPPGVHRIVATLKNGLHIQSKQPFFVQVPAQLKPLRKAAVSSIVPTATANGCPAEFINPKNPGPFGMKLVLQYQVLDQQTPGMPITATMPLREDLINLTVDGTLTDNNSVFDQIVTASGTTQSDGTFVDDPVGACAPGPFGSATFTQRLFIPLSDGISPSVRTNNFAQTGRLGCGSMTNGVDITVTVACH
ncbi:MAG TPA: hypothetical protein VG759_03235 [Candidatus Angelobacter sp.]|nr:hypothetical protein [Candidatus Angelobacter sp.]